MEGASTAPPREGDCRASERSYPCAVKSNLKLDTPLENWTPRWKIGHPAGKLDTPLEVRKSHSRVLCMGALACKQMKNHEHNYRANRS